ncbi:MAG: hypothetical protein HYY02_03145 [Chloroflexi bacterium]|nr:hypothetical protein [Chloroflexota bacterium]
MIQAGSLGIPYAPVIGLAGTDLYRRRDDVTITPNPFDPEEHTVVVRALNPDVAIFHATKVDRSGNALLRWHPDNEDLQVARASRRVIVTAEEVVDQVSPYDSGGVFLPTINVTAVVHAPGGAHPTGVNGYYELDREHVLEYQRCSVSDELFRSFLDKYVFGVTEEEYAHRYGRAPVKV